MMVQVFCEHPSANGMENETKHIVECVLKEEGRNAEIGIVFVDDEKMRSLNKTYLNHDYVTDVLSFSLDKNVEVIEGEIYICYDQALRQADEYGVSLKNEVARLVIHGVLHLIGFDDATSELKSAMKEKEDKYLKDLQIV